VLGNGYGGFVALQMAMPPSRDRKQLILAARRAVSRKRARSLPASWLRRPMPNGLAAINRRRGDVAVLFRA